MALVQWFCGFIFSQTAPKNPTVTLCFKLLALPLELRQQVYEEYFAECSSLHEKIHKNVLPRERTNFTLPLLLVNKQVSEEVLDVLKRRKQYVYRVTAQKAYFDSLAKSCIRARGIQRGDYASIPQLNIEILAPHPDRPDDMCDIFSRIVKLCIVLRAIDQLQHISIVFIEDDVATWAIAGKPRFSLSLWQELDDCSDIEWVLFALADLSNTTKITIKLPDSLESDAKLPDMPPWEVVIQSPSVPRLLVANSKTTSGESDR